VNITGQGQYSKQVAGIKDPRNIMNSQQKLIFIYPMLYADKIKVQSSQPFEGLVRDFISVTFLSDIFVQNTFNLIGMANQIRPLWDENRQAVDPTSGIVPYSNYPTVYTTPTSTQYPIGSEHAGRIEQKITQKTAIIQHLLKTDPKFSKLRPFVEIITMGNMIEVPVIVGTASYPVDTLTLMYVLIAALGMNKKLSKKSDLELIFHELETLNEKKYWTLLTHLTRDNPNDVESLANWFRGYAVSGLKRISNIQRVQNVPRLQRFINTRRDKMQLKMNEVPELNPQNQQFSPLLLKKSNLDQTKLYFNFVLDSDLTNSQFGIDTATSATRVKTLAQVKFRGEIDKIGELTMAHYRNLIGEVGTSILFSISNLIRIEGYSVDAMDQKYNIIDNQMMDKIETHLKYILEIIDESLQDPSSLTSTRSKIKILEDLCKIDAAPILKDVVESLPSLKVSRADFGEKDYKDFLIFFDDLTSQSRSFSLKIENEIKFLVAAKYKGRITSAFNRLSEIVNEHIDDFFQPFIADLTDTSNSRLAQVTASDITNIKAKTIPRFKAGLTDIFYFMLLAQLQRSLCSFTLTLDADYENITNEVTAWPNYTLVLPIEIITALHAATMGISWEHMLGGGRQGTAIVKVDNEVRDDLTGAIITKEKSKPMDKETLNRSSIVDVNENYVKGIMKFIWQRLDVPNLIVVDAKKGEIYYKLMNQTSVNKTKISTIDTFIQSKLNRQMTSQF